MMVTPFLFSGAIPVSDLPAPVFSGRQFLWPSHEVKRLRDNSRCRFSPQAGGHRNKRSSLSSTGMTSRNRDLNVVSREAAGPHLSFWKSGVRDFSAPAAFSFMLRAQ
jgi:hypothetical protein